MIPPTMRQLAQDRYTILYVDDEPSNLRIFKSTFRRDFNILAADSPFVAVELIKLYSIDLLVTDQMMPDMSGVELLKEIMEIYPDIPPSRVMLSGYAQPDDINLAFEEYNLYKFLSKPWEKEELKRLMIDAIESANR